MRSRSSCCCATTARSRRDSSSCRRRRRVLSEGIAEAGADVVLDDEARGRAVRRPRAARHRARRPELTERIAKALEPLGTVGVDAALHDPRGRCVGRGGPGVHRALAPRDARAGRAQRALRHRPDLARLRDHVHGGPRPLPRLRRRRSGAVPHAADRARPRRRPARRADRSPSVAVATEYGLYIDGEVGRGCLRRAARAARAGDGRGARARRDGGEADVDRAVAAARAALDGAWGKTPGTERSRLLHALADAIVANREGARRARGAKRRQGDLVGQGGARRRDRAVPLLRLGDRVDRAAARTRSAARCSSTRRRSPSASPRRSSRGTTRC